MSPMGMSKCEDTKMAPVSLSVFLKKGEIGHWFSKQTHPHHGDIPITAHPLQSWDAPPLV